MNEPEQLINTWVNFSKYHDRISNSLNHALQERYQLGLKEFYALMFLSQSEDKKLRLSQLQKMVGLSQSAMSRLVSRLETHNFHAVERSAYEDDKRGIFIILTPGGEQQITNIIKEVNELLSESISEKDIININKLTD